MTGSRNHKSSAIFFPKHTSKFDDAEISRNSTRLTQIHHVFIQKVTNCVSDNVIFLSE